MEFKLIIKKIKNTLTDDESAVFDAWYSESPEHRIYFNKVKQHYQNGYDVVDIEKGWKGVSAKIRNKNFGGRHLKYAVAIVIFLAIGSLWFFNRESLKTDKPEQTVEVKAKPIEIGTDKATLTLEDGSKIALKKGKHYTSDKVSSNGEQLVYGRSNDKVEERMALNTLTIPRGGQFFVILADGTKVWVNSETQLKYPVAFPPNKAREVTLVYGEAFFEVSPSELHNGERFVVHSDGQRVEVLGTEFNIKAYRGDNLVATTLAEGEVLVENGNTSKNLTPGHQARLNRNSGKFTVSEVDVYDEVSWKDGLFSFKDRSLEEIMQVLSRWYDIEVVYQNQETKAMTFNGVFRKTLQLDEILNIIKSTNEVNYKIKDKTITMK